MDTNQSQSQSGGTSSSSSSLSSESQARELRRRKILENSQSRLDYLNGKFRF